MDTLYGGMPPVALDDDTLAKVKEWAIQLGYRFEALEDGSGERMVRPDGSVALVARKGAKSAENPHEARPGTPGRS